MFNHFAALGRIDIVVDNRLGNSAVYYLPDGLRFGSPVMMSAPPTRPRIVGSMQAFGAWMAFHLAAAYRPEVP